MLGLNRKPNGSAKCWNYRTCHHSSCQGLWSLNSHLYACAVSSLSAGPFSHTPLTFKCLFDSSLPAAHLASDQTEELIDCYTLSVASYDVSIRLPWSTCFMCPPFPSGQQWQISHDLVDRRMGVRGQTCSLRPRTEATFYE